MAKTASDHVQNTAGDSDDPETYYDQGSTGRCEDGSNVASVTSWKYTVSHALVELGTT